MRRQKAGQIRIIEAFLAVLIVFSSFTLSTGLTVSRNADRRDDLVSVGLQALMVLDSDGGFGKSITESNWTGLRNQLELVLPAGVSFNLTVYDSQMNIVNDAIVSNGGFSSQEVSLVEYACSEQATTYRGYVIHLYLAVTT